jgi:hypothetical protein
MPVGSAPSAIAAGSTCPKPTPDGPNAPDAPNAADPLPPPGSEGPVVVALVVVVVVMAEAIVVDVPLAGTVEVVAVRPAPVRPA